jgi:hypothetical protein
VTPISRDMPLLRAFAEQAELVSKTEVEKVLAFAFLAATAEKVAAFSQSDVFRWFDEAGFHRPNWSRLTQRLRSTRMVVPDPQTGALRLHARALPLLSSKYKSYVHLEPPEVIAISDSILPTVLTVSTRGYLESLAAQVNAAYDANIFDGCAVLMRRLLEICLIHAFEHCGDGALIHRPDGRYRDLSELISDAKMSAALSLSPATKACLDDFRIVGTSLHTKFTTMQNGRISSVLCLSIALPSRSFFIKRA